MSGLNQQFTKLSNLNWFREFESRSLRKLNAVKAAERSDVLSTSRARFERRSGSCVSLRGCEAVTRQTFAAAKV